MTEQVKFGIELLTRKLESLGWETQGEINITLDWWADSIQKLTRNQNGIEKELYLIMYIDPEWGDGELDYRKRKNRKQGEGVYYIGLATSIPQKRSQSIELVIDVKGLNVKHLDLIDKNFKDF